MKGIRTLFLNKNWMKGLLGITACLMMFCLMRIDALAAEGTVKAQTAKIRKEASTDSEVIGSTAQGKTVDIVGGVKDASGTVWYKVPNGNNTYGYIRSDLIETSDEIEITGSSSTGSSDDSSGNTSKPAETVPTAIGEQQATITESSVRVRSGASTQHDTVETLTQGTTITLIGEANDSAGNKWYQMTCNHNNKTVEGYVRSDLISIGAPVESEEEQPTEGTETPEDTEATEGAADGDGQMAGEGVAEGTETENTQVQQTPAEPEHNDYEVVYNDGEYWLYINTEGTMMKVSEVLNVVETANENHEKLTNQITSNKIIIVILGAIIVLLVIAITILIFKFRDLYYEDYYEDEEEDEEEEEPPVLVKKAKRVSVEVEEAPVRKKQSVLPKETEAAVQRKEQPELQAAERKAPVKKQAPRKTQNFLLDDDEFEFEFLNMDDKDL